METIVEQREGKQDPALRSGQGRSDDGLPPMNTSGVWVRVAATVGAAVWAGMAVLARMGIARVGAIELLFLFAPLVIVPLGMELGRVIGGVGRLEELARRVQPLGAAMAVVAIWLPPGRKAGATALAWLGACLLMAGGGVVRVVGALWGNAGGGLSASRSPATHSSVSHSPQTRATLITLGVAQIDLAVGGAWLVASRLGMRPMGIQEPIGLLTAVHFHFAGFAAATIAAATLGLAERCGVYGWLKTVVLVVVGMPYVVAAGFVISPALKMGAAVLFSAGVAGLAIAVHGSGRRAEDGVARVLLQIAGTAVFAGMVLSAVYAIADFRGSDALTIPQMARTHGILNAFGFCLAGLLGWLVENSARRSSE